MASVASGVSQESLFGKKKAPPHRLERADDQRLLRSKKKNGLVNVLDGDSSWICAYVLMYVLRA